MVVPSSSPDASNGGDFDDGCGPAAIARTSEMPVLSVVAASASFVHSPQPTGNLSRDAVSCKPTESRVNLPCPQTLSPRSPNAANASPGSSPRGDKENTPRVSSNSAGSSSQRSSEKPGKAKTQAESPVISSGPRKTITPKAPRLTQARTALLNSGWYKSPRALEIRSVLHGKAFALVMIVSLFFALFMNDIWVLVGVNSNLALNVVLTLVMSLFCLELCGLTAVDAQYLFSFFQLMDVVGTFSMVFDIPWMFGVDATQPASYSSSDNDAKRNFMLLRALRAAKVGARAGRLSRVLRLLRFLPFMAWNEYDARTGISSVISGQLSNILGTRVACLTILLVMVAPIFDIYTFPQTDLSLQTWVDRLSTNLLDGRVQDTLDELSMMTEYYDALPFGPYEACAGYVSEDAFICSEPNALASWTADFSAPHRRASALFVFTDTFMVSFNMHEPVQREACIGVATILFIVVLMVFSGLALSSVVTELAVRPLERMLDKVKEIAQTVFKFSADMAAQEEEEVIDVDGSNEMKLLEKVVQKLAIIAEMQTAQRVPEETEDMNAEDIAILSMMHGKNIVEESLKQKERESRRILVGPKKKVAPLPSVRIEDLGVTPDSYNSWGLNTLQLSSEQRKGVTEFTISRFHDSGDGFFTTEEDVSMLQRFLQAAEREYLNVPFHSFAHAADVVHGVARLMRVTGAQHFLSELEQYSLLIAAVGHDLGHPGINNGFLSEIGHELAMEYNDKSPLENMHCAKLYKIVADPQTNVFASLTKDQYKEVRKHCVETILHTDMTLHTAMVKELQMFYQMNMEIFVDEAVEAVMLGSDLSQTELVVFRESEAKTLVMQCFLHSADVSNPCRTWEVTQMWAWQCLEEFFLQGDQEKEKGIPVQFLNDRDKLNKPHSQIGFIEFMIAPFFAAQLRLWPTMRELGYNLGTNLGCWKDMWVEQTSPVLEEREKVEARVEKVRKTLEDSIFRAPQ